MMWFSSGVQWKKKNKGKVERKKKKTHYETKLIASLLMNFSVNGDLLMSAPTNVQV